MGPAHAWFGVVQLVVGGRLWWFLRPLADAGETRPFPFLILVEDFDHLEIDQGSGLLQGRPPDFQELTLPVAREYAQPLQPFQISHHLFEVPIQWGEDVINEEFGSIFAKGSVPGIFAVLSFGFGHTIWPLLARMKSTHHGRIEKSSFGLSARASPIGDHVVPCKLTLLACIELTLGAEMLLPWDDRDHWRTRWLHGNAHLFHSVAR
jgi:hypothetical protein